MHYDFVPLPERKPLKWPNGARLALIVTINLEFWDLLKDGTDPYYAGGPPVVPDPLPANVADFTNYSWREYGQRVGVWRMIDAFDQAGLAASCTMNAKMGTERRAVVDAVNQRGWELVAHNFEQGDLLTNYAFDPAGEKELILKALNFGFNRAQFSAVQPRILGIYCRASCVSGFQRILLFLEGITLHFLPVFGV